MAETPTTGLDERTSLFYSELRAVASASREDAERVLPIAEVQVEKHRSLVADLRALLERAEQELDHWATAAANLRASIDPSITPPGAGLGGRALAEIAITVLQESGKAQPIHYRDWMQHVRLAGHSIGGVDPQATFLTAIGRHKGIESIGNRTGLWKLADGDA